MSQAPKAGASGVDVDTLELAEPADAAAPFEPTATGEEALAALRQQLEQAQAKAEENWKLYLSAHAEADNIRKRSERDIQNAHKFALREFIDALLPVKDSLESGVASETADAAQLREGSELTLKMLVGVLEKFGVQEINPLGEKFDPALHEAMAMQPSDRTEPNTVLYVIQKGYSLNDRLVRPARVIVAQAAPKGAAH